MADNKFSIYAGPPIQAALAHLQDGASRSGRLNTIAERYLEIVKRSTPALALGEWYALVDNLNGTLLAEVLTVRGIALNVADEPELADKWGIDHAALVRRLSGMAFPELVAIAEVVERFWNGDYTAPEREALAKAGAKISP